MRISLSRGDEPDIRFAKRVNDHQNPFVDQTEYDPAFLTVLLAGIEPLLPMRVQKNTGGVRKGNSVTKKIRSRLGRIPLEVQAIWHSPLHRLESHSSSLSLPVSADQIFW